MTMWFDRVPGQLYGIESQEHADPRLDEVAILHMGPGAVPDWVALPPELGGTRHRVISSEQGRCPMCVDVKLVLHIKIEHPDKLCVSECLEHGFVWHIHRKAKSCSDDEKP